MSRAGPPPWRRPLALLEPGDAPRLLLLLGLVVALFREVALFGRVLYERDIHVFWIPQGAAFARAVLGGAWPVWDPHMGFGQPMLANPNTQSLYPPTWLHLLLQPWTQLSALVVGHLALAAAGLYFLGRRLGLSRDAALLSAAAWTASGPLLSLVSMHHLLSACWMPSVLLATERAFASHSWRDRVALAGAACAQLLAGSPDMTLLTGLLAGAHALRGASWRAPAAAANRRLVATGAAAAALAAGLAAAQWLPAAELVGRSARLALSDEARGYWSLHPLQLLQAVLPVLYKDIPLAPGGRPLPAELQAPMLHSVYLGLPALCFALLGLAVSRSRHRAFLGAAFALAVLLALGRFFVVHPLLAAVMPLLSTSRHPMKAAVPAALAFALLCGLGFDAWRERAGEALSRGARRAFLAVLVLGAAAGLLGAAAWLAPGLFRPLVLARDAAALPGLLRPAAADLLRAGLLGAAVALLGLVARLRVAPLAPVAAAALAVLDLAAFNAAVNPTAPRELYTQRPPLLAVLDGTRSPRVFAWDYLRFRVAGGPALPDMAPLVPEGWPPSFARAVSLQRYLYPPSAGRFGVYGSFDADIMGLYPAPLRTLVLELRRVQFTPALVRLLRAGSVDRVIALHDPGLAGLAPIASLPDLFPQPIRVFRVEDPLPRAYAVPGVRGVGGEGELGALEDPSLDLASTVLLPGVSSRPAPAGFHARVETLARRSDRVLLRAELSHPGHVVLVEAWDPGWRAVVDGRPAALLRANVAFRAVPVEAGAHQVELIYRPPRLALGFGLSGLCVLAGALLFFGRRDLEAPGLRA